MPKIAIEKSSDKDEYHLLLDDFPMATLLPIPRGSFLREDNCTVTVDAFYMAQFPVTQELYEAVMGENLANFRGKNNPIESVRWYDAIAFCEKLNKKLDYNPGFYSINKNLKDNNNHNNADELKWTVNKNQNGNGFRLPIESEWEYAAKGYLQMEKYNQYSGSNILDHVGWYAQNNNYETKPPGLRFPNSFGLFDLSGNVWEWCWEWYHTYDKIDSILPFDSIGGDERSMRGGTWGGPSEISKTNRRDAFDPDRPYYALGFRLVFVP